MSMPSVERVTRVVLAARYALVLEHIRLVLRANYCTDT